MYTDGSVSWYADPDESIWKRNAYWDDETDAVTYASFYGASSAAGADGYERHDLFRVWRSFCYHRPD
jgi:hypothetical protein